MTPRAIGDMVASEFCARSRGWTEMLANGTAVKLDKLRP
jgi:hypothetical protein